jgi:hypothetical protein
MSNSSCCNKSKCAVYVIAILGCFLIMAALVKIMQHKTSSGALGADRAEERRKNLVTVRAEADHALKNYAWQDQSKGLVRLPVERAMEVALQEWQNPQAARSNLIARVEKATAPAPKAPEKPSEFE